MLDKYVIYSYPEKYAGSGFNLEQRTSANCLVSTCHGYTHLTNLLYAEDFLCRVHYCHHMTVFIEDLIFL